MKKIYIISIFVLIQISIFAAPFGLKMGMTIEEISTQCEDIPSFIKDDIYLIKPNKNHPLFDYYAVYVNKKIGLYEIRAISSPITTNKFGTELKNAFYDLKDRISKTYGKPKLNNKYNNLANSYYQKDEYWFYSLKEGARELSAIWGDNTILADNLDIVVLECSFVSGLFDGTGQLILYYYFNNTNSVENEQDSVF